ncbi:class I SAM-dependent methyltransferase [Verrucomicrobiota bacterium]
MLDVGGGGDWSWSGMNFSRPVTVINLQKWDNVPDNIHYIQGNACRMDMLADKSFDLAFPNSVIEHVGDFEKQQQMANEIRRVAESYWVQTPYKHFPLEVHMMFPFFQYLPLKVRAWLGVRCHFLLR